ncbi:uncharacterized protein (DUF58 family) [Paenibacillus shirakamiensis]|uniref:Uncharacterized protein (DUF58 family) n=1 Tax=Paenibacillus shirakamiensis TaxID=1265935 RepID=A0ABS4JJ48_9BACL|nr:DUF58 domain-containing protein [Paenibacillus shirakamiensis]MBP2001727.1 uncharacterized protein (DUF58 family) [Paenibacillus shirakamiensis]
MRTLLGPWICSGMLTAGLLFLYAEHGGYSVLFLFIVTGFMMVQGLIAQGAGPVRIEAIREGPISRLTADQQLNYTLHFTFIGGIPPLWVEIHDPLALEAGQAAPMYIFNGYRRQIRVTQDIYGLRRGIYKSDHISIICGDMFGWFIRKYNVQQEGLFIVFPKIGEVKPTLSFHGSNTGIEVNVEPLIGPGNPGMFIRQYEIGDAWRSIHWKGSSKQARLLTRISEQETLQHNLIVLDCHKGSYTEMDNTTTELTFEKAVCYAVSCIKTACNQSARVHFHLSYSRILHESSSSTEDEAMVMLAGAQISDQGPTSADCIKSLAIGEMPAHTLFITGHLSETLVAASLTSFAFRERSLAIIIVSQNSSGLLLREEAERAEILKQVGIKVEHAHFSSSLPAVGGGL